MNNKVENNLSKILASVEGIQPAEVPPYFYTRLKVRMQSTLEEIKVPFFQLRPAFLATSLSIILIINIIFLFKTAERSKTSKNSSNSKATIESFADAYNLNVTSVYE